MKVNGTSYQVLEFMGSDKQAELYPDYHREIPEDVWILRGVRGAIRRLTRCANTGAFHIMDLNGNIRSVRKDNVEVV